MHISTRAFKMSLRADSLKTAVQGLNSLLLCYCRFGPLWPPFRPQAQPSSLRAQASILLAVDAPTLMHAYGSELSRSSLLAVLTQPRSTAFPRHRTVKAGLCKVQPSTIQQYDVDLEPVRSLPGLAHRAHPSPITSDFASTRFPKQKPRTANWAKR